MSSASTWTFWSTFITNSIFENIDNSDVSPSLNKLIRKPIPLKEIFQNVFRRKTANLIPRLVPSKVANFSKSVRTTTILDFFSLPDAKRDAYIYKLLIGAINLVIAHPPNVKASVYF